MVNSDTDLILLGDHRRQVGWERSKKQASYANRPDSVPVVSFVSWLKRFPEALELVKDNVVSASFTKGKKGYVEKGFASRTSTVLNARLQQEECAAKKED